MQQLLFQPHEYQHPKLYLFKETELGRIHSAIPWDILNTCLPEQDIIKPGPSQFLSNAGMFGMMFLKHTLNISDEKLIERFNTDWSCQLFCGKLLGDDEKVRNTAFVSNIRSYIAHNADLDGIQEILLGSSPMPAEGFDPNETHGNGGMASLPEPPKAYLNFVLVDKDDRILKIWDRRVSKEAAISPDALDKDHEELVIEEQMESAGYLLIFLSHVEASENIDLFFDDMHITHTHGPLVQYNDYFPFGMVNPAQSYLRERTLPNRYGFNGIESLESLGVKLNQTYFRLYDPQFARWMGVDPVDFHAYNGYHFSFNNPINFSDFWGDCPWRDIDDRKCDELTEEEWESMTLETVDVYGCRDCWDDFMDIAIDLEIGNEWFEYDKGDRMLGAELFGRNVNDWVSIGVAVNAIFIAGIEIGVHPSQRPKYWGPNDFKNAAKVGKRLAMRLSIAGATISIYQAFHNPTGGNIIDAIFATVGAIPGYGTAIGGIYFGADLLTLGITGKDISGHIDSYIWMPNPAGIGFIPVTKISGK